MTTAGWAEPNPGIIAAMADEEQPGREIPGPWAGLGGVDAASRGGHAAVRTVRMTAAVVLILLGTLISLIAFGMPTEPGEVGQSGFLILWYALPVVGTGAAVCLVPGVARRAGVPLLIAVISLSGWIALFLLW